VVNTYLIKNYLITSITFVISAYVGIAQSLSLAQRKENLTTYLDSLVDVGELPSYSMAVYIDGKSQYYYNGLANRAHNITADSLTVYEIGSITKTFTSLLAQTLIDHDKGLINWNDPIVKYLGSELPDFPEYIRLRHLATHTSGMPRIPDNLLAEADLIDPYVDYTAEKLMTYLKTIKKLDTTTTPAYSNLGMGLLGHIMAKQSGLPLSELMEQYVLKPLKLKSAGLEKSYNQQTMAKGYEMMEERPRWSFDVLSGAGAIDMNAMDLLSYLQAQMDKSSPIYEAALKTQKAQYRFGNRFMGLGWFGLRTNGKTLLFHNGGTGGYRATVALSPEEDHAFVLLLNSTMEIDPLLAYYLGLLPDLPKNQKIISLADDILEEYNGVYTLSPQFKITILRTGSQLMVKATGQVASPIYPSAKDKFFSKVVDAEIHFQRDENDEIESLTLLQGGREMKGMREE